LVRKGKEVSFPGQQKRATGKGVKGSAGLIGKLKSSHRPTPHSVPLDYGEISAKWDEGCRKQKQKETTGSRGKR